PCITIASLQLTRGAARGRELAMRRSLGATRGRLVAQLLVESTVLASVGGALGLALGSAATRVLVRLVPSGAVPRLENVSIDGRLLFFTLATSLATGLIVALWPALRASDPTLAPALRDGGGRDGRGGSAGTTPRFRRALVVAEIALALVLVIGAGLVLQSLRRILDVDPGFRPERLVTMQLSLARARYPDSVQLSFYRDLVARLTSQPAIQSAAAVNIPPLSAGGIVTPIRLVGRPPVDGASPIMSAVTAVTPGYFRVMGMPLLRGRDVAWSDARPTLVVNASAARRFWPNDDPIGKRIAFGARDTVGLAIVGVVADARTR